MDACGHVRMIYPPAMRHRPACYPRPSPAVLAGSSDLPLLDVLTSPVPVGRFDSPVDHRHVLCVFSMKMSRRMLVIVELNLYPVEACDNWHPEGAFLT